MSRIDGYGNAGSVHHAETQQIDVQEELKAKTTQHAQVLPDADRSAYLKLSGATPVPEFDGAAKPADPVSGEKALASFDQHIGVDYTAIMELIIKLSSEERRSSSDAAVMDIQAVASQMKVSANDIRSGAALALAGGIVSSTINIGAGVVAIGGGVKGMSVASEANAKGVTPTEIEATNPETSGGAESELSSPSSELAGKAPGETGTIDAESSETSALETTEDAADTAEQDISETQSKQQTQSDEVTEMKKSMTSFAREGRMFMLSQRAHSISAMYQGVSSSMQGAGQAVGSLGKFGSDMYQAKAKEDEAKAQQLQAGLEKEREYGKSVADDVKKMMDIFTQIEQSRHDTRLKIMDTI